MTTWLPVAPLLRDTQRRRVIIVIALIAPLLALAEQVLRGVVEPQLRSPQAMLEALWLGGAFSVGVLLFLTASYHLGWVMVQFRPAHAALLPGLRKRLMWQALVTTLGFPLLLSLPLGLPAPGLALVWLAGVVVVTAIFSFLRSRVAGSALLLAWLSLAGAGQLPLLQTWFAALQDHPALLVAVGVAGAVLGLRWVFNARGDPHISAWESAVNAFFDRENTARTDTGSQPAWRPFARCVRWRMQQGACSANQLFCYASGPKLHWSHPTGLYAATSLVCMAVLEAQRQLADRIPEWFAVLCWAGLLFLPLMFMMWIAGLPAILQASRGERALMHLAERAPAPAVQRLQLLAYLRRQAVLQWAAVMLLLAGLSWRYAPAGMGPLATLAAGMSLLPWLMALIRRPLLETAADANTLLTGVLHGCLMALTLAAFIGWTSDQDGPALWLCCAGLLTLTLLIAAWRSWGMRRFPSPPLDSRA